MTAKDIPEPDPELTLEELGQAVQPQVDRMAAELGREPTSFEVLDLLAQAATTAIVAEDEIRRLTEGETE